MGPLLYVHHTRTSLRRTARTHAPCVTTGNLRLNHLRIKPDALSALQLPVVLKHGYVGSLHIVIPFAGLKSTPVQVNLENVFIVARLVRKFDGQEHVKGMRKATDQAILVPNPNAHPNPDPNPGPDPDTNPNPNSHPNPDQAILGANVAEEAS